MTLESRSQIPDDATSDRRIVPGRHRQFQSAQCRLESGEVQRGWTLALNSPAVQAMFHRSGSTKGSVFNSDARTSGSSNVARQKRFIVAEVAIQPGPPVSPDMASSQR